MKKTTIILLSVLFFIGCKKENQKPAKENQKTFFRAVITSPNETMTTKVVLRETAANDNTVENKELKIEIKDSVITIFNKHSFDVKVVLKNTIEDTVLITANGSIIVHQISGKQWIGAQIVGSSCQDCWLQLVTDCNLLPIKIDGFTSKILSHNKAQIDFNISMVSTDTKCKIQASNDLKTWHVINVSDLEAFEGARHYSFIVSF